MDRPVGSQDQQVLRAGKRDVMLSHPIEVRDAVFGLPIRSGTVVGQRTSHRVHIPVINVQRANYHHRPLSPLGLVDGGDCDSRRRSVSPRTTKTVSCGNAAGWNACVLQCVQIGARHVVLYGVQQEGHLVVA